MKTAPQAAAVGGEERSEAQPSKVANNKRGTSAQKSAPRGRNKEKPPRTRAQPRPYPYDSKRGGAKPLPPREGKVHASRDRPKPLDKPGPKDQSASKVSSEPNSNPVTNS